MNQLHLPVTFFQQKNNSMELHNGNAIYNQMDVVLERYSAIDHVFH